MGTRVLNFKEGHIDSLPDWLAIPDIGLTMICGPGDYVHYHPDKGRFVTNVEEFIAYNVFVCLGDEGLHSNRVHTSVEENDQFLIDNNYNKPICLIDITNVDQMRNFTELFGDKVILISCQDHHSPVFNADDCFKLLKAGGIVNLKHPLADIRAGYPTEGAFHKAELDTFRHYGFKCQHQEFVDIATHRSHPTSLVCTKKDYSNNLFGGKRRRRTIKRKARKNRTRKNR